MRDGVRRRVREWIRKVCFFWGADSVLLLGEEVWTVDFRNRCGPLTVEIVYGAI